MLDIGLSKTKNFVLRGHFLSDMNNLLDRTKLCLKKTSLGTNPRSLGKIFLQDLLNFTLGGLPWRFSQASKNNFMLNLKKNLCYSYYIKNIVNLKGMPKVWLLTGLVLGYMIFFCYYALKTDLFVYFSFLYMIIFAPRNFSSENCVGLLITKIKHV